MTRGRAQAAAAAAGFALATVGCALPVPAAYALTLRDPASGKEVARLVSEAGPQLLHLDARAIVVRTGGQVVRYTVDRT